LIKSLELKNADFNLAKNKSRHFSYFVDIFIYLVSFLYFVEP